MFSSPGTIGGNRSFPPYIPSLSTGLGTGKKVKSMFALFLFSLFAVLAIVAVASVVDGGLRWWSLFEKLRRDAAITAQMLEMLQASQAAPASATVGATQFQPVRGPSNQQRLNQSRNGRMWANRQSAPRREVSRAAA